MVERPQQPVVTIYVFLVLMLALILKMVRAEVPPPVIGLVGIAGILLSPALAYLLHRLFLPRTDYQGALHIPIALGLALGVSICAALVFSGSGQVFASFGAMKKVAIPATFLIFLVGLMMPARNSPVVPPAWWRALVAILLGSLAFEVLVPRQPIDLNALLQGTGLMGNVLLVSMFVFKFPSLTARAQSWVLLILIGVALGAAVVTLPLGVFVALEVPGAALLAVMAVRGHRHRLLAALGSAVICVALWLRVAGNDAVSIAWIAQIAVCLGIVVLITLPRRARMVGFVLAAIGGALYLVRNGTAGLMLGQSGGETDVTLVHRAYEAQVVYQSISKDPLSLMFGLGPGATVDLSASPDIATLTASGRDLGAVDDVHFLVVWIVLKFGLLGAVWLAGVFVIVARVTWRKLNADVIPIFDMGMLLFMLTGFTSSLVAATHLFANPLPFLCLAVLQAQSLVERRDAQLASAPDFHPVSAYAPASVLDAQPLRIRRPAAGSG